MNEIRGKDAERKRRRRARVGRWAVLALVLALATAAAAVRDARAQPPSAPTGQPAPAASPVPTERLADLFPQAAELSRLASDLDLAIATLTATADLGAGIDRLGAQLGELQRRVREPGPGDADALEQLNDLRGERGALETRRKEIGAALAARLERLEALRDEWREQQQRWKQWERVAGEADAPGEAREAVRGARARIAQSLERIAGGYYPLIALQTRLAGIEELEAAVHRELDRLTAAVRSSLFQASSPLLVSWGFLAELRALDASALVAGAPAIGELREALTPPRALVLGVQVLLALVLALNLRRRRRQASPTARAEGSLRRPLSAATLLVLVAFSPLYQTAPAPLTLVLWALAIASSMRLLPGQLRAAWQVRILAGVGVLFLASVPMRLLGLPRPLFRLYVFAAGLAGGVALAMLARRLRGATGWRRLRPLLAAAAASGLLLAAAAELSGLDILAVHVFEASAKTCFLFLFARLVSGLLHRGLHLLMASRLTEWSAAVASHRAVIAESIGVVGGVVVYGVAGLVALQTWGLFDSPWHAWRSLTSMGISAGGLELTTGRLFALAALLHAVRLASRAVHALFVDEIIPKRGIDPGVGHSAARLLQYCLIAAASVLALQILGTDFRGFALVGGALGVGIGFGLQNIVNNFVSGLILLVERPIEVGDVIRVGDQWGTVQSLGLRATVLMTFDRSELIVPNSELISGPVVNWTLTDRTARLAVMVSVAYGSDVAAVMRLLLEVARDDVRVATDPEPTIVFKDFRESSLDFEVRVVVRDIDDRLSVESDLRCRLYERLQAAGVVIPFPRRDIRIVEDAPRPHQDPDRGGGRP